MWLCSCSAFSQGLAYCLYNPNPEWPWPRLVPLTCTEFSRRLLAISPGLSLAKAVRI